MFNQTIRTAKTKNKPHRPQQPPGSRQRRDRGCKLKITSTSNQTKKRQKQNAKFQNTTKTKDEASTKDDHAQKQKPKTAENLWTTNTTQNTTTLMISEQGKEHERDPDPEIGGLQPRVIWHGANVSVARVCCVQHNLDAGSLLCNTMNSTLCTVTSTICSTVHS